MIPLSIGYWEDASTGTGGACRRLHKPDDIVPWDEWKEGDLAHNTEWSDTDFMEAPVEIMGRTDDGQINIRRTKINKEGKHSPSGEIKTVPFLVNHKRHEQ